MKKLINLGAAAMTVVMLNITTAGAQQRLPDEIAKGQPSDVPIATQILRWHMNDGDVNAFAFRNMDELFTIRTVPHSGAAWVLPREDHKLDFSYEFNGKTFIAEDFLERSYTNAFLVMKNGKIVTEIYRNNSDASTRFMGWSMTKSITAMLVGAAVADGYIASIDDPVVKYLPELKKGGYREVTLRQILEMRSGVDYEERYDFANPGIAASNHINALVKNVARFADAGLDIGTAAKPGEVFAYKTIDTAILGWVIERVTGGTVAAYTTEKLWEPLGAEADGFYIMDGKPGVGREFSGAGFNATLRDWARFGQMLVNEGTVDGRQVVNSDWIKTARTPVGSEEGPEGGYGFQFWTREGSEAYKALGLQGQYVYVDPDTQTVMVKLSYFPPADDTPYAETEAFFGALTNWVPK